MVRFRRSRWSDFRTSSPGEPADGRPRHIILTGPNGSGKTGILNALARQMLPLADVTLRGAGLNVSPGSSPDRCITRHDEIDVEWTQTFNAIGPDAFGGVLWYHHTARSAGHAVISGNVAGELPRRSQGRMWARVDRAELLPDHDRWFAAVRATIREFTSDPELELEELRDSNHNFSYCVVRGDGYRFPFHEFAGGHEAFASIVLHLAQRAGAALPTELASKRYGFAIIDEIETHLHPTLQSAALPRLTALFPNVQFLVATHSPVVISSVKNALVYDLGSRSEVTSEQLQGIRFGTLMTQHFGLKSEFDGETTALLIELRRLCALAALTVEQVARKEWLSAELSDRSPMLAVEVWLATRRMDSGVLPGGLTT